MLVNLVEKRVSKFLTQQCTVRSSTVPPDPKIETMFGICVLKKQIFTLI
jgi:hypothetical protein